MAADAVAMEKLELVASLSAPLSQHLPPGSSPEDLSTVLNKFHTARDKHIFRREFEISTLISYFLTVHVLLHSLFTFHHSHNFYYFHLITNTTQF